MFKDIGNVFEFVFEGEDESECQFVLRLCLCYFEEVLVLKVVKAEKGKVDVLYNLFIFSGANAGLCFDVLEDEVVSFLYFVFLPFERLEHKLAVGVRLF